VPRQAHALSGQRVEDRRADDRVPGAREGVAPELVERDQQDEGPVGVDRPMLRKTEPADGRCGPSVTRRGAFVWSRPMSVSLRHLDEVPSSHPDGRIADRLGRAWS
jgi:hypothetical protein